MKFSHHVSINFIHFNDNSSVLGLKIFLILLFQMIIFEFRTYLSYHLNFMQLNQNFDPLYYCFTKYFKDIFKVLIFPMLLYSNYAINLSQMDLWLDFNLLVLLLFDINFDFIEFIHLYLELGIIYHFQT